MHDDRDATASVFPPSLKRRPSSRLSRSSQESTSTVWEPTETTNSTSRSEPIRASSRDAALIEILDAPLQSGETAAAGFARKERELCALLAQLSIQESREVHHRLANPRTSDVLASKFGRLTIERRTRLLAFVADARRREALQAASR